MDPDIAEYPCNNCTERLGDIYVQCAKCDDLRLCLECFSCGAEFSYHERTHPYRVKNAKGKSIFNDPNCPAELWRSAEDVALLDAVERFNLGNWDDVVNHVGNKQRTPKDLRDHYDKFYIRGKIGQITRKNLCIPHIDDQTSPITTSHFTSNDVTTRMNSDDLAMLCYMPGRDDFEKEYNNEAELTIANLSIIHEEDDELDQNIKLAQIDTYIRQLRERQRRKDLIRDYDLVSEFFKQERPQPLTAFRYSQQAFLKRKREKEMKENLRKFTQLLPSSEFNDLVASLIKEMFLKERIEALEQMQKNGIKTIKGRHKLFQPEVKAVKKRRKNRTRFRVGTPRDVRRWQHMRRWQKRWSEAATGDATNNDK